MMSEARFLVFHAITCISFVLLAIVHCEQKKLTTKPQVEKQALEALGAVLEPK